jgi:transcriptional regulator with XRE-family HTH domain
MAMFGPTTKRNVERRAGSLLLLARVQRGWTQKQLADAAGVPTSTIGRIEAGQRQPSLLTLSRILAAADLELRIRLDDYDDHDDILDAHTAQRTPEQRATKKAHQDALVHSFRTATPSPTLAR